MTGALPSNTLLCAEANTRVLQSALPEVADVPQQSLTCGQDISSMVNKPQAWCETTNVKPDNNETQNADVVP